ncbi:hypothetical protein IWX90DRAFT_443520 [Phyllosticta citrichinensis]|uniref:Uncharacterized protein n=1 Tax=Phyllosticta citrichinensis TaxID=1130410 RepID=A0ABR1XIS0_9PEZI
MAADYNAKHLLLCPLARDKISNTTSNSKPQSSKRKKRQKRCRIQQEIASSRSRSQSDNCARCGETRTRITYGSPHHQRADTIPQNQISCLFGAHHLPSPPTNSFPPSPPQQHSKRPQQTSTKKTKSSEDHRSAHKAAPQRRHRRHPSGAARSLLPSLVVWVGTRWFRMCLGPLAPWPPGRAGRQIGDLTAGVGLGPVGR